MIVESDKASTIDHQAMDSPIGSPTVDLAVSMTVVNCALHLDAIE
jgi:hypothetical protein